MKIKQNISLKEKNWFKTGGTTKYYCEPKTENDFKIALNFASKNESNIFILGKGANILVSDNGFDGLTICPQNKNIKIDNNTITADSGVEIQELIDYSLNNNLIGLEDFSHIPGTIGGATYINIHYFDKFLSDFLIKAKVINKKTAEIIEINKDWFNFGYDQSTLQKKEYYLINATFKLKKVNEIKTAYAKGRRDEIIRYRKRQYPNQNTCGSFFRNFHENEVDLIINNKKMTFVAYYLDKLGIKGNLQFGNAQISYKHANMIITKNNAKSSDVIQLAKKIQKLMLDNYGIIPFAECQFIGFKDCPLLNSNYKQHRNNYSLLPHQPSNEHKSVYK
ncbi:UDP-N-acetylmuramate dehydrogenase [Candidatus Dependentiae bacterium]|nr:UDP-N-acetylmuramate dehydrogenase [Candidatus Dependentiae bacterium]